MYDTQDSDAVRSNMVRKIYDPKTSEEKIFKAWRELSAENVKNNPAQTQPIEGFSSVKEICKFTGLSRVTIWRLCSRGEIPFCRVGKRKLFQLSSVAKSIGA